MNLVADRSSLVRVLEPEVMESPEEARDYDTMDHTGVNRLFAADFLAAARSRHVLDGEAELEVLDLGAGTAQIPIELCTQCEQVRVLAVDLSAEMLAVAGDNIKRSGYSSQIGLQLEDAKRLSFADHYFSAVMSNSIVHHIPEPAAALSEAVRVLQKPGGLIFVRDLARPYDELEVRHLVDTYAAGCNPHQRKLFEDSLRAALSVEEMRLLIAELGFDPQTVQPTSDRHWTWMAVAR